MTFYLLTLLILLMVPAGATVARGADQANTAAPSVQLPQGERGAEEFAEALAWFGSQAEQGQADAQFYFGLMHALGKGVPKDYQKALFWFRKAADQGHADAQFELGRLYAVGDGVEQDLVEAYVWTALAAEQGHGRARDIRELIGQQLSPPELERAQQTVRKRLPTPR